MLSSRTVVSVPQDIGHDGVPVDDPDDGDPDLVGALLLRRRLAAARGHQDQRHHPGDEPAELLPAAHRYFISPQALWFS
ncbi:hypothetical protein CQ018_12445 [Arthrobacter sp. MYb227]|nr:hypothetical protein CQ018_12445 [Arthrobacter sp. MYb227]